MCEFIEALEFNGTKANETVQWQVGIGPRTPGSEASALLRANFTTEAEQLGYTVSESNHTSHGIEFTNLFARWNSSTENADQLVLSAHYDSRNIADRDENESNRTMPVPGANDAASGAAVLLELARLIPSMNLTYDVVIFWNDAEDQNNNYTEGAKAWAGNLSAEEQNRTKAFVLLDMVGDADLQLHNVYPGNDTLKERIVVMAEDLGMVDGVDDCAGEPGQDIVQYSTTVGVLDDHVHAHELGIPSIDLMDTVYGEPKFGTFGTYWHTMEDTPDKVSAESLGHVGRLVELGLRTNAFIIEEPSSTVDDVVEDEKRNQSTSPVVEH
ncbi:MAG: M28 family peptidase, partial [Candidatus Poseidonia sp.]|nr:M28 family peptidase [Poseidonia sp.]